MLCCDLVDNLPGDSSLDFVKDSLAGWSVFTAIRLSDGIFELLGRDARRGNWLEKIWVISIFVLGNSPLLLHLL